MRVYNDKQLAIAKENLNWLMIITVLVWLLTLYIHWAFFIFGLFMFASGFVIATVKVHGGSS